MSLVDTGVTIWDSGLTSHGLRIHSRGYGLVSLGLRTHPFESSGLAPHELSFPPLSFSLTPLGLRLPHLSSHESVPTA